MSENMELYISQRDTDKELYSVLQKATLGELQELSGKVWTDFNAHDPGITMLDVLNYALTELDYKLSFPLVDYLTVKEEAFQPAELGLFPPERVFPVNPVTVEDYRKLFLMEVPELENVWIDVDADKGSYRIHLSVFYFMEGIIGEDVRRRVEKLFMSHRNLCETLEEIDFIKLEQVYLSGEVNLMPGADATAVLVAVYQKAYAYLARDVSYEGPEVMKLQGIPPDEWLDGPNDKDVRISTTGSTALRTESELYKLLRQIPGVKSIYSLCIRRKGTGELVNRFDRPYSVYIPQRPGELEEYLKIKVDGMRAVVRFEHFISEFDVNKVTSGNYLKSGSARHFDVERPAGNWRSVYNHDSILDDFPDNYGVNRNGLPGGADKESRARSKQLKAYLSLFDFVFTRGLKELEELKRVMRLDARLNYSVFSPEDFGALLSEGILKEKVVEEDFFSRDVLKLKGRILDMLDGVYGEDSNPDWLNEYNYYEDTEASRLARRVVFLEKIPCWGRDRFRACNWGGPQDGENIPGVKAYVSVLLDWQYDESRAVGNIFPTYNLNYIRKEEYEHQLSRMLKADLIQEQMLNQGNIMPVPLLPGPYSSEDYEQMRTTLPYFYNNLLNDELFRGGIYLENYKIVQVNGHEFLLVFRNQEREVWMSLGRSPDEGKLARMANILRDFLLKLNRESETMYVVENQYFEPAEYFALTVVLAGWSARMVNPRFREICRKLILSRLPAHIRVDFRWLDVDALQKFEISWRQWRRYMQQGNQVEAKEMMKVIQEMLQQR